jgi:hypothetical protein
LDSLQRWIRKKKRNCFMTCLFLSTLCNFKTFIYI